MKEIFNKLLVDLSDNDSLVSAGNSLSVGSMRDYYEKLNYGLIVDSSTPPLLPHKIPNFNIYLATGRLLWMLRGSNSLSEMEYYDRKVSFFSDDGVVIPGSSFGHRIFSKNGNQLEQIIQRLNADSSSRRCVINVYDGTDNFRESRDIPCLLFLAFHIRENRLHLTIQMRSNNAFRLFLYNFYELSFLLKLVSYKTGVASGKIFYNALSMHLYNDDKKQVSLYLNQNANNISHPPFPKFNFENFEESLKHIQELEKFIRNENSNIVLIDYNSNKSSYMEELGSWFDYYLILMHFKLHKSNNQIILNKIKENLNPFFQNLLK